MTDSNATLLSFTGEKFEPCKVCGEPSSGWHCGAVTCEACKKFFLRSINGEDAKYKCIRNQDCVIVRTTRTQCQYCRFQKCKEVGMTNSENTNNPPVAEIFKRFPCAVCKAPSSGIHFGAITCEGCKGFFRRSIKERAPERYRCMENGNCEISAATRNMCRFCRFQKCLKAKMSAQNSRIGRQSNLFKHNIIEWQSRGVRPNADYLVTQRKMKRVKNESLNSAGSTISEYEMTNMNYQNTNINNHQQIINVNQYTNQTYIINNINADGMKIGDANLNSNYNGYYNWPSTNFSQSTSGDVQSTDLLPSANGNTNNNMLFPQVASLPQLTSSIEDSLGDSIKELIKTIYKFYHLHLNPIGLLKKDLIINNNKHSINYNHQAHNAITYNGYQSNNALNNTNSYDVNHYYASLNEILEYFRFYAVKLANFLGNLQEFDRLLSQDKEELIKCSIHSVILLSLQRKCDHYNYFNCDQIKFDKYLKIFPIFFKTSQFMKTVHEKFEKFKLDDKEYALYSTLLVISTGSKYLKDYDKIMDIREKIGTALRQYMFARRNEEITCDEILLMLVYFRKFNSIIQKGITSIYLKINETDREIFKENLFVERVFLPNTQELEFTKPIEILN